jgi:uncharacterized protein
VSPICFNYIENYVLAFILILLYKYIWLFIMIYGKPKNETNGIRLNVLRGIFAEVTNASKTNSPYDTDVKLYGLLTQKATSSKAAAQEFEEAKREDLRDKELSQVSILEEYASSVEIVSEDALKAAIQKVIGERRTKDQPVNIGTVMKDLLGPGGELEGQPVPQAMAAKLIKGMI